MDGSAIIFWGLFLVGVRCVGTDFKRWLWVRHCVSSGMVGVIVVEYLRVTPPPQYVLVDSGVVVLRYTAFL